MRGKKEKFHGNVTCFVERQKTLCAVRSTDLWKAQTVLTWIAQGEQIIARGSALSDTNKLCGYSFMRASQPQAELFICLYTNVCANDSDLV